MENKSVFLLLVTFLVGVAVGLLVARYVPAKYLPAEIRPDLEYEQGTVSDVGTSVLAPGTEQTAPAAGITDFSGAYTQTTPDSSLNTSDSYAQTSPDAGISNYSGSYTQTTPEAGITNTSGDGSTTGTAQ